MNTLVAARHWLMEKVVAEVPLHHFVDCFCSNQHQYAGVFGKGAKRDA